MRYIVLYSLICLLLIHAPPKALADSSSPVQITFLGASNTNTDKWSNGSYVKKLFDLGLPWDELNTINTAVDGTGAFTYYNDSTLLDTRLSEFQSNIIFLMLGGNDFLHAKSVDEFNRDFNFVLSEISNKAPTNTTVLVSNIIWTPLANILPSTSVEKYDQFQEIIANLTSKYNFMPIDVYSATYNQSSFFQKDYIHLNEIGHKTVAEAIDNQTASFLIDKYQITENPRPTLSSSSTKESPLVFGWWVPILLVVNRKHSYNLKDKK